MAVHFSGYGARRDGNRIDFYSEASFGREVPLLSITLNGNDIALDQEFSARAVARLERQEHWEQFLSKIGIMDHVGKFYGIVQHTPPPFVQDDDQMVEYARAIARRLIYVPGIGHGGAERLGQALVKSELM
jgi:hypothetical protein